MKLGDWMIIMLTFFTGVAAGSFVYINGVRDFDIEPVKPVALNNLEIEVVEYGGCARGGGCDSYRIQNDGSYIVLFGNGETIRGVITNDQLLSLKRSIKDADLESQIVLNQPDFCESWVDGVDSKYTIVRNQFTYKLDTCATTVDVDSDLIELLDWLWSQFRNDN